MAPAADMKWDSVAMDECFYFTNCCPQDATFNNGKWNQLEERTRRLAKEYGTVYVVCGPVYEQRDTIRIGANGVAVPHKCFKALMVPKDGSYSAIGFIMSDGLRLHNRFAGIGCWNGSVLQFARQVGEGG